ncbi:hypothetical protein PGT21_008951 [Puccinia graminis f. sp. tritici]|uniref:Uncharacterized protein n=1 Tax=Puccinia graminis f. sp. tritici TaxID=56615 RepID=A0A5B0REG4_PUCGR|nr:hypothetical protein PGT21_008951 [Puccinia graminis f. sp. tritici]KAA1123285.1 hypothetical protein PGTUg99_020461 [Puccinia graminis f. sp. tritici]
MQLSQLKSALRPSSVSSWTQLSQLSDPAQSALEPSSSSSEIQLIQLKHQLQSLTPIPKPNPKPKLRRPRCILSTADSRRKSPWPLRAESRQPRGFLLAIGVI